MWYDKAKQHDDPYSAADSADALVLMTEWNEFKQLDMVRVAAAMKQGVFVGGRNLCESELTTCPKSHTAPHKLQERSAKLEISGLG